jgi:phosphoglycerol transferase MdoB-like AlkP superfamily enzyme
MESLKKFTAKYTEASNEYLKKSIVFFLFLMLARVVEILWINNFKLNSPGAGFELYGMLYDILFSFQLIGYLYLPYLGLFFISSKLANNFYIVLTGVLLIGYIALIGYFKYTAIFLGSDLFAYNTHDIIHIVRAGDIPVIGFSIGFFVSFALIILFYSLITRIALNKTFQSISFFLILISLFFTGITINANHFKNEYASFMAENKLNFFFKSNINFYQNKLQIDDIENLKLESVADDKSIIEHEILKPSYPFFHKNDTEDVLGDFMNVNDSVKPNIVFIIVESLGTAYSGPANYLGSFTPFLDSLGKKSLYWKDFISSAGRTFEVLPTMLGSLPYGETGFGDLKEKSPNHLSLPRLLKKNGYTTTFFYGGDSKFDNMDVFLNFQKLDNIIDEKLFDKNLVKMPSDNNGFSWGYGDQELFNEYLSYTNKEDAKKPRFDVLLTLSMHSPFLVNNQSFYINKLEQRIQELKLTKTQSDFVRTYKDKFTTILYFDESIKQLFKEISKRPSFKNTIFLITGDHRMPEIPISNQIDRFHVPLIIYSPLLKRAKTMEAVSSQFDVPPTFVALLGHSYHLKFPDYSHWIGFALDTTAAFSSKHAYPMMRNKNELVDYLVGKNFVSMNNLYTIDKDFGMNTSNNETTKKETVNRLLIFKQINAIACRKNKLLPDSTYLKW